MAPIIKNVDEAVNCPRSSKGGINSKVCVLADLPDRMATPISCQFCSELDEFNTSPKDVYSRRKACQECILKTQ